MKMSKKAKAEEYDAVAAERDVWRRVAWFHFNEIQPDAMQTIKRDGDTYEFHLYGVEHADGGTLVRVFRSPEQSAMAEAWRFEDWIRIVADIPYDSGFGTDVKIACGRLELTRRAIWRGKDDGDGCQAMNTGEPRGGG